MALKINKKLSKVLSIIGWVLIVALIACLGKIWLWEQNYYQTKSEETRAKADVVLTELENPAYLVELSVSDEDYTRHQVEADSPRYLYIERLEIQARIKKSAVNENTLPVPQNIHDAMWYSGSGKPGQDGVILISGISASKTQKGLFANLDSLEQDDKITIELGRGDKFTYKVREINIINASEATAKLPIAQRRIDDKETLTLITALKNSDDATEYSSIVMIRATKD